MTVNVSVVGWVAGSGCGLPGGVGGSGQGVNGSFAVVEEQIVFYWPASGGYWGTNTNKSAGSGGGGSAVWIGMSSASPLIVAGGGESIDITLRMQW